MTKRQYAILSLSAAIMLAASLLPASPALAVVIYVDNRLGSDTNDGKTQEAVDVRSGPVKSIRRALQKARMGDTIVIANRGLVYYEQLSLNGRHHSGFGKARFTIIGNGATVSGARLIPPTAWEPVGADIWRFSPIRKGHFQLILNNFPVPETEVEPGATTLPEIPEGQWAAFRGAIYYKTPRLQTPDEHEFAFAAGDVGLTMAEVHDVAITDLTFQFFRMDGVSVHNQCRNVIMDNVNCFGNGRAGLFVGETSQAEALNCQFTGNRLHNILIRGRNAALRAEPELKEPPTFID